MDDEFKRLTFRELEEFYNENDYYHEQDPRNRMNFFNTDSPQERQERIQNKINEIKREDALEATGGMLEAMPMSREEGLERKKQIEDEDVKKGISKRVAKGGSMSKQMELFDEGGLKDEGGTVDPVSGNEVPLGSTQEEVRDDIPAQLSEGEFVFPADVVRYLGLEFLMNLRQKAKAGLKRMEEMGQMGNSDEATLPDDIPFTIDDLEMAEGGVVEAQAGTYVAPSIPIFRQGQDKNMLQQNQMSTPQTQQVNTPGVRTVGMANPYQSMGDPYAPVNYQQFLGASARGAPETETRVYKHPDGRIRNVLIVKATGLPVIPGAIEDATKDGFVFEPQPLKEEVKVDSIKQQTSKVQPVSGDDSSDQEQREREEAMYGPGGGRISLGGEIVNRTRMVGTGVKSRELKGSVRNSTTFGIGYTLPGGMIPGSTFIQAINAGLGNIPKGGTAKFTLNGISVVKGSEVANAIIKNPRGDEAKNLIAEHKISRELETKYGLSKREINSMLEANYDTEDGRKEIDANLSTEAQDKLINAVIQESKADDGSIDMNKFNSLPDAVQESYYQAADDRQEGGVDIPDSNISQPSDSNREDFSDYSDDNNDSGGGYDSDNSSGFGADSDTDSGDYEATGGLLTKRKASGKLKDKYKKKMKQGGLASR